MPFKRSFFGRLADVFTGRPTPDEDMMDDLEEKLIGSDIGMDTTLKITEALRAHIREERLKTTDEVKGELKSIIEKTVDKGERGLLSGVRPLFILVTGVNGVGKTTNIAKLASYLKKEGNSVLLVAGDTFRAAASEQLSLWGDRIGVTVIKHGEGADPSAVIYDGVAAAKARNVDVVICDTAGRLQNKKNLMNELAKMYKIIEKNYPKEAVETLLVLDATTGKNAISQAREFGKVTDLTGIILAKTDGTAKGGIIVTLADEFDLPVKYIGFGEGEEDIAAFSPKDFAESIFEER